MLGVQSGTNKKKKSSFRVLQVKKTRRSDCDSGTVQEVTGLAGDAECVAPAVLTWSCTGQTHSTAAVLIGALRAVSAAPLSETDRKCKS